MSNGGMGLEPWDGSYWRSNRKWFSRHKQKTRKIVLREALYITVGNPSYYWTTWTDNEKMFGKFVCWLDTPAREVEVPE